MANIRGTVTNAAGQPIPNLDVTAVDDQRAQVGQVQTQPDGTYDLDIGNNVGDFSVSVSPPDGFQQLPSQLVPIANQNDVVNNIDFQYTPILSGRITDKDGNGLPRNVEAIDDANQAIGPFQADNQGNFSFTALTAGPYTIRVPDVANQPSFLAAHNVEVIANANVVGIDFSENVVQDFLDRLDDSRFSIESIISEDEANQAVSLFSVVNLMLAGLSSRMVGRDEKIDILGVLNLYYGLQEDSLGEKITVADSTRLWSSLEDELKVLAKQLDQLQSDVDFLNREARRQFNLGLSNEVLGNTQFPELFHRLVTIGSDPLLAFDIKQADQNQFFDKTKIAEADALLKDLKGVLLQLVRALSKTGTAATKRANEEWANFEARAIEVLQIVARDRVTPDQDERNSWSVLADLTGKNRETEVAPYVVLARNGGKLLRYAMEIYKQEQNQLDNFDQAHLRDLFQAGNNQATFWTERIREQATVLLRYPLPNWGPVLVG